MSAFQRDPDDVEQWRKDLPSGRQVVVYCVLGQRVSPGLATTLRALGVPADLLQSKGAVCAEVARAMATGALQRSPADLSAAITGVAGPEPDEDGNPVGRVWIAVAGRGGAAQDLVHDYGDIGRDAVRRRAVADTLAALMKVAAEIE